MARHDLSSILGDPASRAWMGRAACRGMDPDLFFPSPGGDHSAVKAVCAVCPVRPECLEHAVVHNEPGIWGGCSQGQRRAMRRQRRQVA